MSLRINDVAPDFVAETTLIGGAISNQEADRLFPGYKTVKPYLRTAAQPQ
jgi:hypothetical protein